jgi:hypothetical protein
MDWQFLARHLGLYTVLLGGGTVGVTFLLPESVGPYALLATIAVGMLLVGKAAIDGGGTGPTSGGDAAGASLGLGGSGNGVFAARKDDGVADAVSLFYAIGLVVFGIGALATIM